MYQIDKQNCKIYSIEKMYYSVYNLVVSLRNVLSALLAGKKRGFVQNLDFFPLIDRKIRKY